jgi:hypothetical protein
VGVSLPDGLLLATVVERSLIEAGTGMLSYLWLKLLVLVVLAFIYGFITSSREEDQSDK